MLDNEEIKYRLLARRALILGGVKGALLLTLLGRLGHLQLAERDKYETLADQNRINLRLKTPVRGIITDRNGAVLAANEQNFRAQIIPEQADDIEASLDALARIIPLSGDALETVIERAKAQSAFIPVSIAENLSWEQVSAIEVNLPDLPGISIDVGQKRYYTEGFATAHVVGYVGSVNKDELKENPNPVLSLPGFRIGKFGIERSYDSVLRGTAGQSRIEVNVNGRTVRELDSTDGVPGAKLQMTLDLELQKRMQMRLDQEKSAAAVVMDANTGAVYAMASSPGFDPNLFATSMPAAVFNKLNTDETRPLSNKAISGQYPPGSTFKIVTLMAGLEAGLIKPDSKVYCPGYLDVGDHRFHCWKPTGHGTVDAIEALAQSCDTFFYNFARDIGIDRIAAMSRRFGLGLKFNAELPESASGLVPDRAWKLNNKNKKLAREPWQPGETVVHSIGQGYLLATPLQLATMTARMVNGGYAVEPWFVLRQDRLLKDGARTRWPKIDVNPDHLALVMAGMDACVNGKTGTARGAMVNEVDWAFGGKTGTSQVKNITKQERSEGIRRQEDVPWPLRHHALFVGFAPLEKPRYVTAVVVEHGGSGAASAAPIAKALFQAAMELDPASHPLGTV